MAWYNFGETTPWHSDPNGPITITTNDMKYIFSEICTAINEREKIMGFGDSDEEDSPWYGSQFYYFPLLESPWAATISYTHWPLRVTLLDGDIDDEQTSISVIDGDMLGEESNFWIFVSSTNYAIIEPSNPLPQAHEWMYCTGRSGNTLTVVRGQKWTYAQSHEDRVYVYYMKHTPSYSDFEGFNLFAYKKTGETVQCPSLFRVLRAQWIKAIARLANEGHRWPAYSLAGATCLCSDAKYNAKLSPPDWPVDN